MISDWRLSFLPNDHMPKMADYISKKFDSVELPLTIVSESHRYELRVNEITNWIQNHPTDGYIIIDDCDWPGYEMDTVKPHWVQTDSRKGLEEKHIEEAVAKMSAPVIQPIVQIGL